MSTPISAMMASAARLPTPVMVAEPVTGHRERGDHLVDAAVQGGDRALQVLQVGKRQPDQQPMMVAEAAPQRLAQLGELGAQPALGQLGSTPGSRSPATRALRIARPETPSTSVATESSLMPASSRVFWMRWHSALWAWISRLR
jgi:hypothetical protein